MKKFLFLVAFLGLTTSAILFISCGENAEDRAKRIAARHEKSVQAKTDTPRKLAIGLNPIALDSLEVIDFSVIPFKKEPEKSTFKDDTVGLEITYSLRAKIHGADSSFNFVVFNRDSESNQERLRKWSEKTSKLLVERKNLPYFSVDVYIYYNEKTRKTYTKVREFDYENPESDSPRTSFQVRQE